MAMRKVIEGVYQEARLWLLEYPHPHRTPAAVAAYMDRHPRRWAGILNRYVKTLEQDPRYPHLMRLMCPRCFLWGDEVIHDCPGWAFRGTGWTTREKG